MTRMRAEAIVLAGGRASRMGGVDKPGLVVAGRRMLDTALAALDWCETVVVVGPHRDDLPAEVMQTQEHPPGSGPVAGIAAGIAALPRTAPHIAVLAADLPLVQPDTIRELARRCGETGRPSFAVDDTGRVQYLIGVWPAEELAQRLSAVESPTNRPVQDLIPPGVTTVHLDGIADCDTPADLAAFDVAPALSIDDARDRLRDGLSRLDAQTSAPLDALGATLSEPLIAAESLPRVDVSAMDGYAVAGDPPWQVRADIGYAGGARPNGLEPGEAVRIATGAHLPEGTTAVLRDEFARIDGARLDRDAAAPVRDDTRPGGEDWQVGAVLAEAGTAVTPALASLAASAEVSTVTVRGPVRAHVVVTGDEIRRDGPLRVGQTRDALGPVLPMFLSHIGIRTDDAAHLRDTATAFDELLDACDDIDLLIVVGATGRGAADQLRGALGRAAARILVPRLAIRPGGSTVVAELPSGVTVLGLPGNPFAALASLSVLAPAIVEGRTGRSARTPLQVPLNNATEAVSSATRVAPAFLSPAGWQATPSVRTAHLGGLVGADGFVIVPPDVRDGDLVELITLPR